MKTIRRRLDFAIMGRSLLSLGQSLCPAPAAKLRLLIVYVFLIASALLGRSRSFRPVRLRLTIGGHERDWWVADAMEVAALWEVFVAREYGDYLPNDARVIIDAGANVGTATAWFRERFPMSKVIAVEPNPLAFERLQKNVGADANVITVHAAVAGADGKLYFAAEAMSIVGHIEATNRPGAVEVEAITLDTLRDRYARASPVDVLKLDVEGSEWEVLAHALRGVETIVLEAHEPAPTGRSPRDVLNEVASREGFELRDGYSDTMAADPLLWLTRNPVTVSA